MHAIEGTGWKKRLPFGSACATSHDKVDAERSVIEYFINDPWQLERFVESHHIWRHAASVQ